MRVSELAEAVRETVEDGAKHGGQAVVQPFGEEIDAAKLADADVGAHVKEGVGVQGMSEPAEFGVIDAHVAKGEGDQGDVSLAIMEIELEGNLRLKELRGDAVVKEDGSVPGTAEEWPIDAMILTGGEAGKLSFDHWSLLHSSAKSASGLGSIRWEMFHQFC